MRAIAHRPYENKSDIIPFPHWTKEEVNRLFQQYATEHNLKIAPELTDEIYRIAEGARLRLGDHT